MTFLTQFLNQAVTYWAVSGKDQFGQPTFAAPKTLKVRWEDRSDQIINPEGVLTRSQARLFLAQDVNEGDYFYKGSSSDTNPRNVSGARRVASFAKIPDLGATSFERKAYLV